MKKAYEQLGKIEMIFCSVLLVSIVLLVFLSTWMRFFKNPITWSIDVSQLMFAWVTFVGADVAYRNCKFIGVDLLVRKMPKTIQHIIALIIDLTIMIVCAFLVKNGLDLTLKNLLRTFQTLPITYAWVNSSLSVGCLLMTITAFTKIVENIKTNFIKLSKIEF